MQVGQAVTCSGSGAFAEYVVAPASSCYAVRQASAETAALAISGLTAAGALEVSQLRACTAPCVPFKGSDLFCLLSLLAMIVMLQCSALNPVALQRLIIMVVQCIGGWRWRFASSALSA